MSITDELREYVGNFYLFRYKDVRERLNEIADRIDIAHKHAIGYVDDRDPETMAENGWVRLPKDADGVPWRIGDVIAWPDGSGLKSVIGIGKDWLFYIDSECEYKADWTVANDKHHATTVEDVLREFADRVCYSGHQWGLDADATIAEYAAKLRLAGEDE